MGRKKARELALHLIFEMSFHEFKAEEIVSERLEESIMASISGDIALYAGKLTAKQVDYIRTVVCGVASHLPELDATIERYSHGWKLSRLSHMTTAILRLALYEMNNMPDVPVGAAINEAVELAKEYDAEDAAGFINGILGSAARAEHPEQALDKEVTPDE